MSRRGVIGVVLTLLVVSQASWGIDPNYYVSPDGNDAWNGEYPTYQGGVHGPKATIQAGINVAGSGSEGSYKFIHVLNDNEQGCTYDVNETILLNQHSYQEIIFYETQACERGGEDDQACAAKERECKFDLTEVKTDLGESGPSDDGRDQCSSYQKSRGYEPECVGQSALA